MINLSFLQNGEIKSVKKSTVIKNVAYVTQVIGGQLVTIQLSPPRNLKVANKKRKTK
jgi:hypothetical protein